MSWRPEGWNAIRVAQDVQGRMFKGVSELDVELLEAGADALLEAVKAQGKLVTTGPYQITWEQEQLLPPNWRGWLVAIPDEEGD